MDSPWLSSSYAYGVSFMQSRSVTITLYIPVKPNPAIATVAISSIQPYPPGLVY